MEKVNRAKLVDFLRYHPHLEMVEKKEKGCIYKQFLDGKRVVQACIVFEDYKLPEYLLRNED